MVGEAEEGKRQNHGHSYSQLNMALAMNLTTSALVSVEYAAP